MKKRIILTMVVVIVILAIGGVIYDKVRIPSDGEKFKEEYEKYNHVKLDDGEYYNLDIKKINPIIYLNDNNIYKEITKGNKIIYFGDSLCNDCRMAVSVLLDVALDNGIDKIYYYNPKSIINSFEKKEENEKSKLYEQLIKQFNGFVQDEKIVMPSVFLVKDGKVKLYHSLTVSSHKDNLEKLTTKEHDELYTVYDDMMVELLMCTDKEEDCN